jgi:predicted nucleic acid-binding protein
MKQKVYIETSVVSYLVARPSRSIVIAAHQASTAQFWDSLAEFEVYISDIVISEASKGDSSQAEKRLNALNNLLVLQLDDEAKELARKFIKFNVIPEKCPEDALHIAIAAVNGMDAIVTWNFKHINNPATRRAIREIVESQGWSCPELCSPEELLGDEI